MLLRAILLSITLDLDLENIQQCMALPTQEYALSFLT